MALSAYGQKKISDLLLEQMEKQKEHDDIIDSWSKRIIEDAKMSPTVMTTNPSTPNVYASLFGGKLTAQPYPPPSGYVPPLPKTYKTNMRRKKKSEEMFNRLGYHEEDTKIMNRTLYVISSPYIQTRVMLVFEHRANGIAFAKFTDQGIGTVNEPELIQPKELEAIIQYISENS